jgi:hypothetical protein
MLTPEQNDAIFGPSIRAFRIIDLPALPKGIARFANLTVSAPQDARSRMNRIMPNMTCELVRNVDYRHNAEKALDCERLTEAKGPDIT